VPPTGGSVESGRESATYAPAQRRIAVFNIRARDGLACREGTVHTHLQQGRVGHANARTRSIGLPSWCTIKSVVPRKWVFVALHVAGGRDAVRPNAVRVFERLVEGLNLQSQKPSQGLADPKAIF
jgi:hypothetical protein